MSSIADKKIGPKEVFLQLLSTAVLYFSAISLGVLLFQFINIYFPDILKVDFYQRESYFSSMRWAVAVLVIVFPVYIWSLWYTRKAELATPELKEMLTRKWLLYFTVFAAAAVIIGDLVTLIFNYLQGETTTRFVLKIASVLFIAAAVFGYYFWELRQEKNPKAAKFVKIAKWGIVIIVAGLVVFGFYSAGSPQSARVLRLDQQRLSDLQGMQNQIVYFWQQKNRLPLNAAELTDSISGYVVPQDPETGLSYEYNVLGNLKFELCGVFKTEGETGNVQVPTEVSKINLYADNWQHSIGRVCFERAIDPQLYKLNK
ncbi:MAG TPA: DUF5671 domain-containing protein [Candidatus Portnoybacteria bacterium]|nr:DUF5671 domain-containing protein [Candidatus Portnoybacteria bacterium]